MNDTDEAEVEDVERVRSLLKFASGVLTARDRVQMRMGDTRLGVFREENIRYLPGLSIDEEEGDWLRLKRQNETKPSQPVGYVADFLENDGCDPNTKPGLKPAIASDVSLDEASDLEEAGLLRSENVHDLIENGVVRQDVKRVILFSADLADMRLQHEKWLAEVWTSWAELERPIRKSIALYNALFKIHSAIHASEGTPPEVIWGFGIGLWSIGDKPIDMPFVEQEVEIEVVPGGDVLLVPRDRPMELSLKPYLEQEIPNSARLQNKLSDLLLSIRVGDANISPLDFSALEPILETAAGELDSEGKFYPRSNLPDEPIKSAKNLQVLSRWAVYVRPRSSAARVQDLNQLAQTIEKSGRCPIALKGFVAPEPDEIEGGDDYDLDDLDKATLSATGTLSHIEEAVGLEPGIRTSEASDKSNRKTYFFPLPYNAEQAQIIDMLEGRGKALKKPAPVVSVTGPPGTGKSHTIANLVSHAMARGQRVLVTARTAEAISVVRDKLPESLQSLVIASTGTDRESIEMLKSAVSKLSDDVVTLDELTANRERSDLERKILDCDKLIADSDKELARIAKLNLERIAVNKRAFKPMDLAPIVLAGEQAFGWFTDRPDQPPSEAVDRAVERLKSLLPKLAPDIDLIGVAIPDVEDIPIVDEILKANASEALRGDRTILDPSAFPPMAVNSSADIDRAQTLAVELRIITSEVESLNSRAKGFLIAASDQGAGAQSIARAATALKSLDLDPTYDMISYGDEVPLAELVAAATRGVAGQKPAPGLFNRSLKAAVASVEVNGSPAKDPEAWRLALGAMRLEIEKPQIASALSELLQEDQILTEAKGSELCKTLRCLREDIGAAGALAARLAAVADQASTLFPVDMDLDAVRRGDCEELANAIEANAPIASEQHPAISKLTKIGELGNHPFFARCKSMSEALGTDDASPQELVRERTELTTELTRILSLKDELQVISTELNVLAESGASEWAKSLLENPINSSELFPDEWMEIWCWAVAARQLDVILESGNGDAIRQNKREAERRRSDLMEQLIRVRTMLGLKKRMGNSVKRAMQAFTQAVSRVGRGTGKTAPRYRAAAQKAAREVSVAAPVWIMPEHRIAEQLPPEIETFDLVILDEASQSDITAVAALARGKQVLVVGDEEQVSPANVGIPSQKIDALRAEHMADLPNADLVDENTSIFEITMRMHPDSHIILKEHFRCVAPIISFSAQFYNNRLVPLRVPKASERFDPPLVDIFIEGAEKKGKTNPSEARAIVEEIATIVANEEHEDRDIGIVSLIGAEQARLIETLLLEHPIIGSEVIRNRRIICGDARTMQGQERSVLFISMVATPEKVVSQTTKDVQQRLNVAMSRGRDRVYLVRSVEASDLKPSDLKLRVIKHFQDPLPEGNKLAGAELIDRCDSGFEREVLGRLLDAGYRAIPQVSAGAYRIDIVVEGNDDRRLAIELDGDAYHGPEKWADDMARQTVLERAGWVFWRVFGSQWEAEKERWWEDLITTLTNMKIDPIGSAAVNDSFTEYRTIEEPNIVEEDEVEAVQLSSLAVGSPETPAIEQDLTPQSEMTVSKPKQTSKPAPSPSKGIANQGSLQADLFETARFGNTEVVQDSIVRVEMDDGRIETYAIVSENPNLESNRILHSSPLGEALLGGFAGEETEYKVKERERRVRILEVVLPEPA